MKRKLLIATVIAAVAALASVFVLLNVWFPLDRYRELFEFYANDEAIAQYVKDSGPYGPIVFIMLQAMQVILAPIPGEATGILGGYLFGTLTDKTNYDMNIIIVVRSSRIRDSFK